MIFRLCLKDTSEVIDIFDAVGLESNVAMVLTKYFWFELKNDDPISTIICKSCWSHVLIFHEFYLGVEKAHRLLADQHNLTIYGDASHCESHVEHIEKPFSPLLAEETRVNNVEEIQYTNILEENYDCALNSLDENKIEPDQIVFVSEMQEACIQSHEIVDYRNFSCDEELSFDEHYFVEKLLQQTQHLDDEEDKLKLKNEASEIRELRRSARNKDLKSTGSTYMSCRQPITFESDAGDESFTDVTTNIGKPRNKGRQSNTFQSRCKKTLAVSSKRRTKQIKTQANDEKISSYMRLICYLCTDEVSTFAKLRNHFAQKHEQHTAYVMCCNKKFYKRVLLVEHIDKHLDPECYKCKECNKIFADKQCLRNHMLLKHQPEEVKTFACEQCPKKFAKAYLLEQHLIVHAAKEHICDVCQKRFPGAPQLASHMKISHSSSYGTMCHICAKVIRGPAAFERHQLEHAGVKLPRVQCEKCGSWHKDKYSLQKHRRRHNDEGTLHMCNICNKVAPNRSALLSHFRYVHASERTYECSVCKKAFKKPLNLKEHMTMHTGEVLYSCPYCPKTFNSNANMHSHRKKLHPREFEEQRRLRRNINAADVTQQPINLNAESVIISSPPEENKNTIISSTIYTS